MDSARSRVADLYCRVLENFTLDVQVPFHHVWLVRVVLNPFQFRGSGKRSTLGCVRFWKIDTRNLTARDDAGAHKERRNTHRSVLNDGVVDRYQIVVHAEAGPDGHLVVFLRIPCNSDTWRKIPLR